MKKKLLKGISIACCIGLFAGIVGCDNSEEPYVPTEEELTSWETNGISFGGYNFPVMPLATSEVATGLNAERNVAVEVTDEVVGWGNLIRVKDKYVLKNTSAEDISFTAYYPYIGSMVTDEYAVASQMPIMQVDGELADGRYYSSKCVSGYYNVYINGFADLKNQAKTEGLFPEIEKDTAVWENTVVNVYSFTCPEPPAPDCDYVELEIYYENPEGAKILSNELSGWGGDDAGDFLSVTYDSMLQDEIVIMAFGGEIEFDRSKQVFQYRYGEACQEVVCEIEIAEETSSIEKIMDEYGNDFRYLVEAYGATLDKAVTSEEFKIVVGNALAEWAATDLDAAGYDSINDVRGFGANVVMKGRYCYLYEDIVIPAGESVTVTVEQEKESSYNPKNGQRHADDIYDWFGFEIATNFGSNLSFARQTASFTIADEVIVMADNFIPDASGEILLDKELHYLYFLTAESMERQFTQPGTAAKPVIYLYPEEETDVTVELDLEGELTSTWPKYDESTGWQVTASPDGTLVDKDGYEYSYLFWEGELEQELDFSEGFVVSGEDSAEFLRDKLSFMGLTPAEYNEFIVYWAPILEQNAYNLISFQWENYQDAAKLEITPAPDNMLRVYMAYQPLDEPVEVDEQKLPVLNRIGFTVVEWGGLLYN